MKLSMPILHLTASTTRRLVFPLLFSLLISLLLSAASQNHHNHKFVVAQTTTTTTQAPTPDEEIRPGGILVAVLLFLFVLTIVTGAIGFIQAMFLMALITHFSGIISVNEFFVGFGNSNVAAIACVGVMIEPISRLRVVKDLALYCFGGEPGNRNWQLFKILSIMSLMSLVLPNAPQVMLFSTIIKDACVSSGMNPSFVMLPVVVVIMASNALLISNIMSLIVSGILKDSTKGAEEMGMVDPALSNLVPMVVTMFMCMGLANLMFESELPDEDGGGKDGAAGATKGYLSNVQYSVLLQALPLGKDLTVMSSQKMIGRTVSELLALAPSTCRKNIEAAGVIVEPALENYAPPAVTAAEPVSHREQTTKEKAAEEANTTSPKASGETTAKHEEKEEEEEDDKDQQHEQQLVTTNNEPTSDGDAITTKTAADGNEEHEEAATEKKASPASPSPESDPSSPSGGGGGGVPTFLEGQAALDHVIQLNDRVIFTGSTFDIMAMKAVTKLAWVGLAEIGAMFVRARNAAAAAAAAAGTETFSSTLPDIGVVGSSSSPDIVVGGGPNSLQAAAAAAAMAAGADVQIHVDDDDLPLGDEKIWWSTTGTFENTLMSSSGGDVLGATGFDREEKTVRDDDEHNKKPPTANDGGATSQQKTKSSHASDNTKEAATVTATPSSGGRHQRRGANEAVVAQQLKPKSEFDHEDDDEIHRTHIYRSYGGPASFEPKKPEDEGEEAGDGTGSFPANASRSSLADEEAQQTTNTTGNPRLTAIKLPRVTSTTATTSENNSASPSSPQTPSKPPHKSKKHQHHHHQQTRAATYVIKRTRDGLEAFHAVDNNEIRRVRYGVVVVANKNPAIGHRLEDRLFVEEFNCSVLGLCRYVDGKSLYGREMSMHVLQPGDSLFIRLRPKAFKFFQNRMNLDNFFDVEGLDLITNLVEPVLKNNYMYVPDIFVGLVDKCLTWETVINRDGSRYVLLPSWFDNLSMLIFLGVIIAALTGIDLSIASVVGLGLYLVLGIKTFREVISLIEWELIVAVSISFALGNAVQNSGLAKVIGQGISKSGASGFPLLLLTGFLTAFLSNILGSIGALQLMFPVALQMFKQANMPVKLAAVMITNTAIGGFFTMLGNPLTIIIATKTAYKGSEIFLFGLPIFVVYNLLTAVFAALEYKIF